MNLLRKLPVLLLASACNTGANLLDGDAGRAIATAGWDVVVLQQGPSSLASSRVQLIRDTRLFADEALASWGAAAARR